MSDHAADIDRHVRTYILVFVSLLVLTVVTVAVYYLELSTPAAIALLTVVFFCVLLLVPMWTSISDPVVS